MLRPTVDSAVSLERQTIQQQFVDIPLLSVEAKADLFDPDTHMTRAIYIYDPQRIESHMNANLYMQGLYHTGAVLINKGMAYNPNQQPGLIRDSEMIADLSQEPMADLSRRNQLLAYYHNLDSFSNQNKGSEAGSKSAFHTLFILKVALDHLPAEAILISTKNLQNESRVMTFYPSYYQFPNGSRFADDHAAVSILTQYIFHNPLKFAGMPLSRSIIEEQALENKTSAALSLYTIFGASALRDVDLVKKMAELMSFDPVQVRVQALTGQKSNSFSAWGPGSAALLAPPSSAAQQLSADLQKADEKSNTLEMLRQMNLTG